jgi:hypothetical protein
MPDTTTTIALVFYVGRDDGLPCTCDDLLMLDSHLGDDGDCLSLEGGRFIVGDIRWSTPELIGTRLVVEFEAEVEPWDGDEMSPAALCSEVHDAAILHMPDFLDVEDLRATIA